MAATQDSLAAWFDEVVQPQLDVLSQILTQDRVAYDFDARAFFKLLLADLELLGLDNMVVENCTERIIDGIETLRDENLKLQEDEFKEIAKIALLKSRFDRSLFKSYWSNYLPLMKKHKDLKDESIVNAYKIKLHIAALVNYISVARLADGPLQEVA